MNVPLQDAPESDIETITDEGDVILLLQLEEQDVMGRFRCSRSLLSRNSKYFDVLLDAEKFYEGRSVAKHLEELGRGYKTARDMPPNVLPAVTISVSPISSVKLVMRQVFSILLAALHFQSYPWPFGPRETLRRLAQLVLLGEKVDALKAVKTYVETNDLKSRLRLGSRLYPGEEAIRQQLLISFLLDFPDYVKLHSASLIVEGSKMWLQQSESDDVTHAEEQPPWNALPYGIEEELQMRRHCVLETLSSIQSHFVSIYSREPQCKKCYENSKECDAFHLGQVVRFFTRRGSLRVQSIFTDQESDIYEGNILSLMTRLRECPAYQLDQHHAHCGVRQRLLPILDRLMPQDQVGICLRCWKTERVGESWLEAPSDTQWTSLSRISTQSNGCLKHHALREMYTASDRNWTPSPS